MAVHFAGGTDRIAYDNIPDIVGGSTPVSLALRMRTTQTTANTLLAAKWNSSSRNGFALLLNNTANKIAIIAYGSTSTVRINVASATTVNDGGWHSVVAVIHPTSGATSSLYVDGSLDASGSCSANWSATGTGLQFGKGYESPSFWGVYVGDMADMGYWHNAALTADEAATYAKGFSAYGLRRGSLACHAPWVREVRAVTGTPFYASSPSGTTPVEHPRVIGGTI